MTTNKLQSRILKNATHEEYAQGLVKLILNDKGSCESKEHIIFHQVVTDDPDLIENFCTTAIKKGYEVENPEFYDFPLEIEDVEGNVVDEVFPEGYYQTEVLLESLPNADSIAQQSAEIEELCQSCKVYYARWGTMVEDDEEFEDDDASFDKSDAWFSDSDD